MNENRITTWGTMELPPKFHIEFDDRANPMYILIYENQSVADRTCLDGVWTRTLHERSIHPEDWPAISHFFNTPPNDAVQNLSTKEKQP